MTIQFKNEELILCKERAIYWPAQKLLILSDLHLGKSAFFRKSGIQAPQAIIHTDLHKLDTLLDTYVIDSIIITGDMFHNYINKDVDEFQRWRSNYPALNIKLVKGNHDALKRLDYEKLNIEVIEKELLLKPFRFIHEQPKVIDEYYNISGHIHPGVTIFGKARQRMSFPCFYFGQHCAILPAFSVFTGLSIIKPKEGDHTYAITPDRVLEI
jgi:DNA ligase-associated metallophosphoesterase